MKQITLHIPDNKVPFFMELIKNLKFIKMVGAEEVATKEQVLLGLKNAVDEVKQVKAGKKKALPLSDFLDEL